MGAADGESENSLAEETVFLPQNAGRCGFTDPVRQALGTPFALQPTIAEDSDAHVMKFFAIPPQLINPATDPVPLCSSVAEASGRHDANH